MMVPTRTSARRTTDVDTSSVGIVEFDADKEKRDAVVKQGRTAAERFLATWDWDDYRVKCPASARPD
jgi:hypothetical protein